LNDRERPDPDTEGRSMAVLPPGTILQLMYLDERLRRLPPGRFIEIGPGSGEITQVLLRRGWAGCSYDLEPRTIRRLQERFAVEVSEHRFSAVNQDFLATDGQSKADLVISCMVMEHLEDPMQARFLRVAERVLKPSGLMIGLVPGSPAHWGIEDDIAGHCRRYTRSSIEALAAANQWSLQHLAGLTFPVSNLLLPISNFLVKRSESSKLGMSQLERTKESGRRQVKFKTHFPSVLGMVLNRSTMLPAHLMQKRFSRSEKALVLYFEAKPRSGERNG
jgi:SAM-dependent methyltransferase